MQKISVPKKPVPNMDRQEIDLQELEAYLCGYWLTDLANFSTFLYEGLPKVNWVGFYLSDKKKLRLGPFCGKPACLEIPFGKGVCGQAFVESKILIVDDVDLFPGHIRCDINSRSEIVFPLSISNEVVGVLDIDSPEIARFTIDDRSLIQSAIQILSEKISTTTGVKYGQLY
jgi:L-methionine (R)-S-oxide reductase